MYDDYETLEYFFFSSRRRHTRLQGDWSSDVCSSDLSLGDRAQSGQMSGKSTLVVAGALVGLALLAACSKDKSIEQPAKLTPLSATLRVQRVWSASVDDKKAVALRLGLGLSVAGNRAYAAGHRGDIVAIDVSSGRILWRTRTREIGRAHV